MPQYVIEQRDASAKNTATGAHISHPFTNEKQVSTDNCIRFAFGRGSGAGTNLLHTRSQKRVRLRRHLHHRTAMPPHTRHNKPFVRTVGRSRVPFPACACGGDGRERGVRGQTDGFQLSHPQTTTSAATTHFPGRRLIHIPPRRHLRHCVGYWVGDLEGKTGKMRHMHSNSLAASLPRFPMRDSCHGHANKQEKEETRQLDGIRGVDATVIA